MFVYIFRDLTSPFVVKVIRTMEEELAAVVVGGVEPIPIWEARPEPEVGPPEVPWRQVATDTDPVEIVSAVRPVRTVVTATAGRVA